jgi:protein gp37
MGAETKISWTEKTYNPWKGCKMISPGCANCYMFRDMRRYGQDPEVVARTKPGTFNAPLKWNREAEAAGKRELVFTCSWSDFFIVDADPWRDEVWTIIKRTPWLIYQVLTKRPERIADHLPADWGEGYDNVGLGVSVETASYFKRIDILRKIPAKVRFISAEPLLGPLTGIDLTGIHWLISGGESDANFRPMDPAWALELRDLCEVAGVAFFHKQGSAVKPGQHEMLDGKLYHNWPACWVGSEPLEMVS